MTEAQDVEAGTPCPACGGPLRVDEQQDPTSLVARKVKNAASPSAAARFAAACQQKAAEHGVIHRCVGCGYRARFHATRPAA